MSVSRRPRSRTTLILALLVALPVMVGIGAPKAEAFSGAEFTTIQIGSRGDDVRALQYLLNQHGYSTSVDGVFGSGTKSKVQAFQSAKGLTADGIVGPGTWDKLVVNISLGSSGNAVRAVQWLLNAKRDSTSPKWASVTVDGNFGSGTKSAVQSFQTHMGLSSDGVAGPATWKNLIWHYVLARSTAYICGSNNQPASESWGTAASVESIRKAGVYFNSQNTGDLPFWDFSREHGGSFSPQHSSHQRGMDADIGLISTNDNQCNSGTGGRGMTYSSGYYDRGKTVAMIEDILDASGDGDWIKRAYFNDYAVYSMYGFMDPLSSHDHHIHFRWCVQYYPPSTTSSYNPSGGNYDC